MIKNRNWLRTNEFTESISSLDIANHNFTNVESDLIYWKAIIIMLHNSLQGFMVCSLRGTTNCDILMDKQKEQLMNYLNGLSDNYPKEKLLIFTDLYSRIKSPIFLKNYYKPDKDCDKAIHDLNKFRNDFIHFVPKGLSIEVSVFPIIVKYVLETINFLVYDSKSIIHLTDEERDQIKYLINEISIINKKCYKDYKNNY
jgi:hypothetical protein